MRSMEKLVNGNIEVTIDIHLKYDGHKTVIIQPDSEPAEFDPEKMSPLQKALVQGFQYRDALRMATWLPFPSWRGARTRNARSSFVRCRW